MVAQIRAVDQNIAMSKQGVDVTVILRLQFGECVAAENHHRQSPLLHGRRQIRGPFRMRERLAAKQSDPLDDVAAHRGLDAREEFVHRRRHAAREREHFGIAASGAAQRATLQPQGKPHARAFGLGRGDDLGDVQLHLGARQSNNVGAGDGLVDTTHGHNVRYFCSRKLPTNKLA